uniref:NADH dehydrogenase subunit 6 n=1 Tax=Pelecinus polyturator TaxID=44352 RepID=A0A0E3ELM3_9HYME|nr:NADH dehydrogenase subunit 6 [Pelecinus polyturator]AIW82475.1 NADH dehydrogenase subunit 6 [Pelecinus polyturator]
MMCILSFSLMNQNFFTHPIFLKTLLFFYIIFLSIFMNLMSNSFWYSFLIFLIMIGAMMILFLYFIGFITNLISMLNFKVNKMMLWNLILSLFIYFYSLFNENFLNFLNFNETFELSLNSNSLINYQDQPSIYLLFNSFNANLTLITIIYLLLMMYCMMMICKKNMFPMRKFKN